MPILSSFCLHCPPGISMSDGLRKSDITPNEFKVRGHFKQKATACQMYSKLDATKWWRWTRSVENTAIGNLSLLAFPIAMFSTDTISVEKQRDFNHMYSLAFQRFQICPLALMFYLVKSLFLVFLQIPSSNSLSP